jgi:hypothetical protein
MRKNVQPALDWLKRQHESGADGWRNACERLQRTAWAVEPARYASATLHFNDVPKKRRRKPKQGRFVPGQIVLMKNSGPGHIATVKDRSGNCWTNDYTGSGKVGVAHISKLIPWCSASDWYACDPWWGNPTERLKLPISVEVQRAMNGRAKPNMRAKKVSRKQAGQVMLVVDKKRKLLTRRLWLKSQGGTWWRAELTDWKSAK